MLKPLLLCAVFALTAFAGSAQGAEPRTAKPRTKAESLIASYRGTNNLNEKLKALRSLEPLRGPLVDQFLEEEYGKLDSTREPGAKLAGGILHLWAAKPDKSVLPFLVYEGLFHDDAEVVRACAGGISKASEDAKALMSTGTTRIGVDPAEALATDLIQRMGERADVLHPLERVLVLWTGKKREGYDPSVDLKKAPSEKDRTVMLEFWRSWYEERFRKKVKP